eukprot:9165825-Pyramimonas_sp.AAC.1
MSPLSTASKAAIVSAERVLRTTRLMRCERHSIGVILVGIPRKNLLSLLSASRMTSPAWLAVFVLPTLP